MLTDNLQWFYPDTLAYAVELIKSRGVVLHGGGTRILKTKSKTINSLVDISKLKLNFITFTDNSYYIGAGSTFNDIISFSRKNKKLNLLGTALSQAASTPLRNRITLGGSLKDFPIWSSLYCPLIVLNARIEILGEYEGIYPVEEYIKTRIINSKHLIKQIIIEDDEFLCGGVKRFAEVKFEYPAFNLAVSLKVLDNIINESRIAITGVKKRFQRFPEAEAILNGNALSEGIISSAIERISPVFRDDFKFSAAYKARIAKIYFSDLLNQLRENIL